VLHKTLVLSSDLRFETVQIRCNECEITYKIDTMMTWNHHCFRIRLPDATSYVSKHIHIPNRDVVVMNFVPLTAKRTTLTYRRSKSINPHCQDISFGFLMTNIFMTGSTEYKLAPSPSFT